MSTQESYCPTVLLVDDERGFAEYLRKKFHKATSIGVIVANSLSEGRQLVDERAIPIDGIVTDLFFDRGTDDAVNNLYDGLDLLEYSQDSRPDAQRYVMSFFSEEGDYRAKADKLGLGVEQWFQKAFYEEDHREKTPWQRVEEDLIRRRLEGRGHASDSHMDAKTSHARDLGPLPVRTFIQNLGHRDRLREVTHPIEVICVKKNRVWRATAIELGLLQSGEGDTVEEALECLQEIIVDHLDLFENEPDGNVVGYALKVTDQLARFVKCRSAPEIELDRRTSSDKLGPDEK